MYCSRETGKRWSSNEKKVQLWGFVPILCLLCALFENRKSASL